MSRVDFPANQSREGGSAGIYHQPSLKTWWTRIDPYCMFDAYCKSPLFQGSFMGIPEYRNPHHPPWCLSSYQQQHWKPDPHRRHGDMGTLGPGRPQYLFLVDAFIFCWWVCLKIEEYLQMIKSCYFIFLICFNVELYDDQPTNMGLYTWFSDKHRCDRCLNLCLWPMATFLSTSSGQ